LAYLVTITSSIATRVASRSDQDTIGASLDAIAENHGLYLFSVTSGLASNVLLLAVAVALYLVFRHRARFMRILGTSLFFGAALAWIVSGTGGLALAALAQASTTFISQDDPILTLAPIIESIREISGSIGFTLSAFALLVFGGIISHNRPVPRWLGWLAIITGLLMLFIWYDAAAALHRIGGTGYLIWLLALGGWLLWPGSKDTTASDLPQ